MCSKKTIKDINVKVFNTITNKNVAKIMSNIFHVIVNTNSIVQHVIKIKSGIMKHVNVSKYYCNCKKDYNWNPSTCIWENSKYLNSIDNTSVITCVEIISVMDIVTTKMTNTIATNVTKNCHSKKVSYKIDCYILHSFLAIKLLLIITIMCYHYTKNRLKQKGINVPTI